MTWGSLSSWDFYQSMSCGCKSRQGQGEGYHRCGGIFHWVGFSSMWGNSLFRSESPEYYSTPYFGIWIYRLKTHVSASWSATPEIDSLGLASSSKQVATSFDCLPFLQEVRYAGDVSWLEGCLPMLVICGLHVCLYCFLLRCHSVLVQSNANKMLVQDSFLSNHRLNVQSMKDCCNKKPFRVYSFFWNEHNTTEVPGKSFNLWPRQIWIPPLVLEVR